MMIDYGASGRTDTFEFFLVDPFDLSDVGRVDVDASGTSLTWGYYTDNILSGSISMIDCDSKTDQKNYLVRVKHLMKIGSYQEVTVLGTLFVDASGIDHLHKRVKRNMNAYSTMWRFTQDVLSQDFVRRHGYNVVRAIRDIVETEGGRLVVENGVDDARCFSRDIFFEMGTNRATVINTIAGWINCTIGVDGNGYITIGPYVSPRDKAVKYTFEAGCNCTYLPGAKVSDGQGDTVNRVIAYYSRESVQDGDPYPLTDRYVADLPDAHEFSFARIGRRKTHVMRTDNPCTHEELSTSAEIFLAENCGATRYMEFSHVSIPWLKVGDVVRYINSIDFSPAIDVCGMITEMNIRSLVPGLETDTKMKVIS